MSVKKSKLQERIAAIFGKAQDEAIKIAVETADEDMPKEDKKTDDAGAMDEIKKMVADLGAKIEAMKPKDEEKPVPKKEDKAGDEEEVAPSVEDRLKALETGLAKLLEAQSSAAAGDEDEGDDDESEDEDTDLVGDEDMPPKKDSKGKTGDEAARAEILAPGMKFAKDVKAKALKAAYATKDGKAVIHQLTGGRTPDFTKTEQVDVLFIAASEVLKSSRTEELSHTKQVRDSNVFSVVGGMTPEKMNELNAKHYNSK